MAFVSQNEKEFNSMMHPVAVEAPHAVTADGPHAVAADGTHADPMRSPETDPMQLLQTGVCTRTPQLPPVELGAEGQALRKRLRAFRTQAVRKNYKVSTRPPVTLPLSPRVLICIFLTGAQRTTYLVRRLHVTSQLLQRKRQRRKSE
jgi:hypothetical protein